MNVILASQSPRRKELLEQMGFAPQIVPCCTEEIIDPALPLDEALEQVAYVKAKSVACPGQNTVIAADTVVVKDGDILGKPATESEAVECLMRLSDDTHQVKTAVCVIQGETEITFTVTTEVTFKDLQEEEILAYVKTGSCMDKAGAYGIQDCGFVQGIKGSYSNVVGLPTEMLGAVLTEMEQTENLH